MSLIYIPPVQMTGHAVRSPSSPRGSAQRYLLDSPAGTPDAPFEVPPQHGGARCATTKSRRRLFTTERDPVVRTEEQPADTVEAVEPRRTQRGCGLWRCFARLFRRRQTKVRLDDGDQRLTASLDGVVVIAP